jgi:myo-inositol 2-dehydrogenase/D-chiro-inositol 1-dehydrogenase
MLWQNRKHVLAEKPIGPDATTEWNLVHEIEASDRLVAVNLFNRNAWYHKDIQRFIAEGEIGDLAVIRISHMTPGHMPLEATTPKVRHSMTAACTMSTAGPLVRAERIRTWHAQGLRMWDYKDPW